jgi:hypothetical protein
VVIWPDAPRYASAFVPGTAPPLLRGIDLYHAGLLWEAHEQWEVIWRASADPTEREFLQALIQIAAALLKLRGGNPRGAEKLARRAREHLRRVDRERCLGLALAPLRAFVAVPLRYEDAPRLEPS